MMQVIPKQRFSLEEKIKIIDALRDVKSIDGDLLLRIASVLTEEVPWERITYTTSSIGDGDYMRCLACGKSYPAGTRHTCPTAQ